MGVEGQGWIHDSTFQEVDIETGELLFEWRAADHYAVNESLYPIGSAGRSPEEPFDFFHINSIDKDDEGNYVVSSRFMHTVTSISAATGEILWVLGGKRNQFKDLSDGKATDFKWQHHATLQKDGMISIFDNAKYKKWYTEIWDHGEISRGMLISYDTANMTAELVQEFANPTLRGAPQQGSMQVLKSGNVLLGWGYHGAYTEYSPDGEVLCDTHINPSITFNFGFVHSYRAFRAAVWVGQPKTQPSIYMQSGDGRVYVSWMGATEVDRWVLQTANEVSADESDFVDVSTELKDGFETMIESPEGTYRYLRVAAVDDKGRVLATTKIISANLKASSSGGRVLAIIAGCCIGCLVVMGLLTRKKLGRAFKTGEYRSQLTFWPKSRCSRFVEEDDRILKSELEPLHDG